MIYKNKTNLNLEIFDEKFKDHNEKTKENEEVYINIFRVQGAEIMEKAK
jgi:hypothetical protein